ncbi:MAG: TIM barrel protein [Bullifex sp.]
MKLGIVVASENALPSAFAVFRGIEKSAETIHRLGYDGMELALRESDEITHQELRQILKKNSLEVSAISTGQVFAARGLMFTDPDKEKRAELYKSFTGFIDLASEFGGLVNVGRVRGSIGKRDKAVAEGLFLELMGEVADYAEKRGVTIILEPVNRYEIDYINTVDQGAELVRKMGRSNFALMPDVFHMNIEDAKIGESLIRNREMVRYVHLADTNRLSCGDGHMNWDDVFSALFKMHYDGWCSVECFPVPDAETAAERTVRFLRERYI